MLDGILATSQQTILSWRSRREIAAPTRSLQLPLRRIDPPTSAGRTRCKHAPMRSIRRAP